MSEALRSLSWLPAVRFADLIDIAVVASFVYAVIHWVRESRSRFVLSGLGAIATVYLAARVLDMYLTLFLFQLGLTVALLALVVIFQEDIRRGFERLAAGQWLRRQTAPAAASERTAWLDPVVKATVTLAEKRVGALMVFRGREPLERHLTGGNDLRGLVSVPLLLSIFDTSSPGHDGALVIETGLVTKFGAHLPLSDRHDALAGHGTRHAAALGLCERSDALILVVSEERGTISLAHRGELRKIDATELAGELARFVDAQKPAADSSWLAGTLRRHWGSKLAALGAAAVAWAAVQGRESTTLERTVEVPVVYRAVPQGIRLDEPEPQQATVMLRGTVRAFSRFDPGNLSITINAQYLRAGSHKVRIGTDHLDLPDGVELVSATPDQLQIVARATEIVRLPVRPKLGGQLPPGRQLISATAEPKEIELEIRRADRGRYGSVPTAGIDLAELGITDSVTVELRPPPDTTLAPNAPRTVTVTLKTRPTR